MHKGFLKTAALFGVLSVALGAFAAHSLKQYIAEYAVSIFETGVRYQFYHVFALLTCGILYKEFQNRFIKAAGKLFIAGIILFGHSSMDRMFGYGLKLKEGFKYTHLGMIGKK